MDGKHTAEGGLPVVIRLRKLTLIVALLAVVFVASGVGHWVAEPALKAVTSLVVARQVPIYRVDVADKRIAISFDATWGTENTDEILDILNVYGVKTTFFLAGNWLREYPEYVQKIADHGHEIGNHSLTHPHMNALSKEAIQRELTANHELIKQITGQDAFLFRPPFGEYSDKVIEAAREVDYYTIQWSVDSLDWRDLTSAQIVERVMNRAGPGEIVLFHNAGKGTPAALRTILPNLQRQGYEVVPISELIYKDGYFVEEHSGTQRPKRGQTRGGESGTTLMPDA